LYYDRNNLDQTPTEEEVAETQVASAVE